MRFSIPVAVTMVAVGSTLALTALGAEEKKPDGATTTTTTTSSAAATDGTAGTASSTSTTTTTDTTAAGTGTAAGDAEVTTTSTTNTAIGSTSDQPLDKSDPREIAGQTYYFIGARYRHTYLPTGILHLFVDAGPKSAVSIPSGGIEAGMRKDNFEIIGAITYADYSLSTFPFKGKSEADTAYERVTSNLKLINLSADFLWGTDFNPKFAFQYGVTAGIAVVLGDLKRNQARPANGSAPGDPYTYVDCAGVKDPSNGGSGAYCDDSNDHYGEYKDASWFNGGKKPNFYPIFGPMVAFRWKPVHQFVARVDGGFNLFSGFFFGLALNYGI